MLWSLCITPECQTLCALAGDWRFAAKQGLQLFIATGCAQQPSLHAHNYAKACSLCFSAAFGFLHNRQGAVSLALLGVGGFGLVWLGMLQGTNGIGSLGLPSAARIFACDSVGVAILPTSIGKLST
jgi:hypothetical protein